MAVKRIGGQTVKFERPPALRGWAAVAGKREGQGPLAQEFDRIYTDTLLGEKSWEKAESRMQQDALQLAAEKADIKPKLLDMVFAGDLMNQCIASSYGLRGVGRPFIGLYGACSTMAESLMLASAAVDGGFAANTAALTSSHFASAERQFRTPLEYGAQRTPTAQWTVTGAGAVIVSEDLTPPENGNALVRVTHAVSGRIVDLGITDTNNMGAAMAPAAHDTLSALFRDVDAEPADFDLIVTGDLGRVGFDILCELFRRDGVTPAKNMNDCGLMIFDIEGQDVHAGGSGCGCSAAVLCGKLLDELASRRMKRIVFAGTGALMSPTSTMQGESIPGICHAVVISSEETGGGEDDN